MATNNFFEELKKYFETTTREKVIEDWGKSEEFDEIGPTVEEFLAHTSKHYEAHLKDPVESEMNFKSNNNSPKFSSGFLFNQYSHSCKKPHFQ